MDFADLVPWGASAAVARTRFVGAPPVAPGAHDRATISRGRDLMYPSDGYDHGPKIAKPASPAEWWPTGTRGPSRRERQVRRARWSSMSGTFQIRLNSGAEFSVWPLYGLVWCLVGYTAFRVGLPAAQGTECLARPGARARSVQ
eukprot:4696064-Prymnesium_polylepis.1